MATYSSILAWRILWTKEFSPWCHKESDLTATFTSLHFTFPLKGERKVSIIPTFLPPGARAAVSLWGYFKDFANNPLGLISRSTGCGCPSSGRRTAVYQIILPPHLPEFAQTQRLFHYIILLGQIVGNSYFTCNDGSVQFSYSVTQSCLTL